MARRFDGKVALVTGGTSGIGRATVLAFAREGAKVVFTGRREKEGSEVVEEIKRELDLEDVTERVLFLKSDVSKTEDVQQMVEKTVAKFGRLDVAFNNAGVLQQPMIPIHEQSLEEFDRVMNINVRGLWLCNRAEVAQMLKNGGGVILNMSSICGVIAYPSCEIYIASKHAVNGITKSVALTYAKQNIRVNAINPGAVKTAMWDSFEDDTRIMLEKLHPVGRPGTVDEIANLALFLCSDQASFITGQTYLVDGGFTTQ
eukprot:TRINITY_DN5742_c0_g1_i1.p1 TRINITY_DN5742_c0_g1~~TRINITY_DN5742_c0_g1_i1.p1  ORF type:complete len:258 (+),score=41.13 TRINITY_DN5742_c0_g1_i1:91-864(+)